MRNIDSKLNIPAAWQISLLLVTMGLSGVFCTLDSASFKKPALAAEGVVYEDNLLFDMESSLSASSCGRACAVRGDACLAFTYTPPTSHQTSRCRGHSVVMTSSSSSLHSFGTVVFAKVLPPCSSDPCQNRGTCLETGGDAYSCTCSAGYTGSDCQTVLPPCSSDPCQNGGTCLETGGDAYSCTCSAGYTGSDCQTAWNACSLNPCLNGGQCAAQGTTYSCACATGYAGTNCEIDSWQTSVCMSDTDCAPKDTECISGGCQCEVGYYYSTIQDSCLADCPFANLTDKFVTYPNYNIVAYNLELIYPGSPAGCMNACLANSKCRVAEWYVRSKSCNLCSVTFRTAPPSARNYNAADWYHYQRTCAI